MSLSVIFFAGAGLLMLACPHWFYKSDERSDSGLFESDEAKIKKTRNLAFLMLAVSGCFLIVNLSQMSSEKKPLDTTKITPAPPINFGPPVTEVECREFGKKLEAAALAGDKAAVENLLRIDALVQRSASDLGLSQAFRNGVMAGFRRAGEGRLEEIVISAAKGGGNYTLLRVQTVGGRPHALMRLFHPEQGLNYHRIALARHPDGQVASEDIYILIAGETLSQLFRRFVLPIVAEQNRSLLDRLRGTEQLYTKHMPNIQEMITATRQEKFAQALTCYRQLPPALQREKMLLLTAIVLAQKGNDEQEYVALLESYRRHFPSDAAIDLLSVGYHFLKQEYDSMVQCFERIDQAVGGDPYLYLMAGSSLLEAGRLPDAKAQLEKAVARDPALEAAYWGRITAALREKNHADTLLWLKKIVENCDAVVDDETMKQTEEYAEFVKSSQFKAFLDWQKARQQ